MAGDPHYPDVSLLLHCDGSNGSTTFTDHGPDGLTVTAQGNAQVSTAQSKFGGASAYLDGNGDYLSASSGDFSFGTSDYTVEFWFNSASGYTATAKTFAAVWQTTNFAWIIQATNASIGVSWGNGSAYAGALGYSWTPIAAGTWAHFAIARSGTTLRVFLNGTKVAEGGQTTTLLAPTNPLLSIGFNLDGNQQPFDGYIDDFRITKGVARYTEDFTPPTAAFSDYAPSNTLVTALSGSLQWVGGTPAVWGDGSRTVAPLAGSLQWVGSTPLVGADGSHAVAPGTGHVTVLGYTPVASGGNHQYLAAAAGHVWLNNHELHGHHPLLIGIGLHDGNLVVTSVSPPVLVPGQFNEITLHGAGFTEYTRVLVLLGHTLDWPSRDAIEYPEQEVLDANTITARVFLYDTAPGLLLRVENFLLPFTEIPAAYRSGPTIFHIAARNQDGSTLIAVDQGDDRHRLGISTDYGVTWSTLSDSVPTSTQITGCMQAEWSDTGELLSPSYWSVSSDTGVSNDASGYYSLSHGVFDFITALEWGLTPYQQWPDITPKMMPLHLYRDGFSAMAAWPSAELYPEQFSFFHAGAPLLGNAALDSIFQFGQPSLMVSPAVGGTQVAFFNADIEPETIYLVEDGAVVATIATADNPYEDYGNQLYLSKDGERAYTTYYYSGRLLSLDFTAAPGAQASVLFDAKAYTGATAWISSFSCSDDGAKFIVNGGGGVFISKDSGQHWRYKAGRQIDPPVGGSIGAYLTFDGSVFREKNAYRERTEDFFSWAEFGLGRDLSYIGTPETGHLLVSGYAANFTGHLYFTGYVPWVVTEYREPSLAPMPGHLIYSGAIPSISSGISWGMTPLMGHLLYSGHLPRVSIDSGNPGPGPGPGMGEPNAHTPTIGRVGYGTDRDAGRWIDLMPHLRQSITDILTTPIGTRVMRREYGSFLFALVDQPMNPALKLDIIQATIGALNRWEPRARVERVEVATLAPGHLTLNLDLTVRQDGRRVRLDGVVV